MKITDLLNIEYPIIQGAMAQISTAPLVGAVSEAGGLGIIASGGMTKDQLKNEIQAVRKMTDKPFGVNLMLMMPGIKDLVEVIIEEKVPVVTTGAGSPKHVLPYLKEAGIKVIPVIPNASIAKKMEDLGCDAVVVEGQEAGGHIGSVSTMVLLPSVVRAVNIPVIAAGGIANGETMAAAYALGADGVQCGTIFLATHECPVPQVYKDMVVEAKETSTIVTGRKMKSPVRSLVTPMTSEYVEKEFAGASKEELLKMTEGSLYEAAVKGNVEKGSFMCGESAGLVNEIVSCETVIKTLMEDAKKVAKNLEIE